jgi:hypothetical protein
MLRIAERKSATIVWPFTSEGLATSTSSVVREVSGPPERFSGRCRSHAADSPDCHARALGNRGRHRLVRPTDTAVARVRAAVRDR